MHICMATSVCVCGCADVGVCEFYDLTDTNYLMPFVLYCSIIKQGLKA